MRILNGLRSQWIGVVALFIALGGTGYAAVAIPRHSIGRAQLRNGAVGSAQLGTRAVTQRSLGRASVGSRQLRTGSVRGNQIAPGAVTSSKLGAGSVGSSQIAAGSVGTGQIAAGAVGSTQLAAGSVGSDQIAAGAVGSTQLAAGSVGPGNLTGIGSYSLAYAIVGPSGIVSSSVPGTTTSGLYGSGTWSNETGEVRFPLGLNDQPCLAFAEVPEPVGGSAVSATAQINPSANSTAVEVQSNAPSGDTVDTAVWLECVA